MKVHVISIAPLRATVFVANLSRHSGELVALNAKHDFLEPGSSATQDFSFFSSIVGTVTSDTGVTHINPRLILSSPLALSPLRRELARQACWPMVAVSGFGSGSTFFQPLTPIY